MTDASSKPAALIIGLDPDGVGALKDALDGAYLTTAVEGRQGALDAAAAKNGAAMTVLAVPPEGDEGLEVCGLLAAAGHLPLVVAANAMDGARETAFLAAGATDVVTRLDAGLIRARVERATGAPPAAAESLLQVAHWLGRIAELKEDPSGWHVIRVGELARHLGMAAGMGHREVELLHTAAPLHDIGKAGIPDSILQKPGRLDEEEWALMKRHTTIGADIIGEPHTPLARMARDVVLTHHERWNGDGYPAGLAGDAIPLAGRIMAIVDVFDALTCDRPYKKAWPLDQAVQLIKREAGTLFDPALVRHFNTIMKEMLNVRLQFGEHGHREGRRGGLRGG